ncbi:ubiquitin receptor RAD23d-like [Raphanus sativus]|uniref:Ubiquitin receptor RAD23 n=1 Tax=Raphanus sativus TaxID=3726 RepID=A0A9W3C3J1_RAPSA|nr:ubiquitin receptor RAD23d-like [Raphanus sativus]
MKIIVKSLKGDRSEIQVNPEDLVVDVKKNVEIVLGVTAAEQVLIHKGKVLKDETTLEANDVSEKSIIGVMKRKPASTGTSANLTAQDHATHPSSTATETPRISGLTPVTPTEPAWDLDDGLDLNYERISESNIQLILEMVRGAWNRKVITTSLRLAYNDVDKALEYLYFGLPARLEDPKTVTRDQTQESEAHEKADLRRLLDSFRPTPEFEYILALMPSEPSIVKDFVEMAEEQDPQLFQLIQNNKAYFLRLLLEGGAGGNEMEQPHHELQPEQTNEPNNGGDGGNQVGESEETEVEQPPQKLQADQTNKPNNGGGDGVNLVGESKETEVEVATPEDHELIEQLEALGFERGDAEVAYFACNKNVQDAADHLLGDKHEPQE